jgi:predicted signal transduction protein with EAL and GGDEF domain
MHDAMALGDCLSEATRECRTEGLWLTLSIGVSTALGAAAKLQPLYEAADYALSEAKSDGRDRVSSAHRKPSGPRPQTQAAPRPPAPAGALQHSPV